MIRTVDSDVLAITAVQQLSVDEIWVAFASGKSFRYLPAHEMAGPEKCILLYLSCMHSAGVTQCYHLLAVGRKLWNIFEEVTQAFCTLASTPDPSTVDDQLEILERFVVLLYDRTSTEMKVNEARKHLFSRKGRPIDGLPPTRASLLEHTRRAAYQAGQVWAQMLVAVPNLPSPSEWGWTSKQATETGK